MTAEKLRLDPSRVVWREVEGEVIALDLRRSLYLAINRSGTVLWPLLERGAEPSELATHLVRTAGIEPDQAERETAEFVKSLREHDLLE